MNVGKHVTARYALITAKKEHADHDHVQHCGCRPCSGH